MAQSMELEMTTLSCRVESTDHQAMEVVSAHTMERMEQVVPSHGLDEWERQRREFKRKVEKSEIDQPSSRVNTMTIDQIEKLMNELVGFQVFDLPRPARLDVMVESLVAEWGSLEDDDHDPAW